MKAATRTPKAYNRGIRFQSTPPVKAATRAYADRIKRFFISIHAAREGGDTPAASAKAPEEISIHAAREGGDGIIRAIKLRGMISIHAAREGGDLMQQCLMIPLPVFQSTPPVKAATPYTDI